MAISKRDWYYDDYSDLPWWEEFSLCIPWLYLVRCILHDLHSLENFDSTTIGVDIVKLQNREILISDFFSDYCDWKLCEEDLNVEWINFTKQYFEKIYPEDRSLCADQEKDWRLIDVQRHAYSILEGHILNRFNERKRKGVIDIDWPAVNIDSISDEDLIELIKNSQSLELGEKEEWISLLPMMDENHKDRMKEILLKEKYDIEKIESQKPKRKKWFGLF